MIIFTNIVSYKDIVKLYKQENWDYLKQNSTKCNNNGMYLNGKCIGSALLYNEYDKMALTHFIIDKKYRNKGYGSLFLNNIISKYNKSIYLLCNEYIINFYNRHGFKVIDTCSYNKNYYIMAN